MTDGQKASITDRKFEENCPECGTESPAQDKIVKLYDYYGAYPMRQWSYQCPNTECDWTWVNEVQRQNNERFHKKAEKSRKAYLVENGIFS
jgi:hypothetical protein